MSKLDDAKSRRLSEVKLLNDVPYVELINICKVFKFTHTISTVATKSENWQILSEVRC